MLLLLLLLLEVVVFTCCCCLIIPLNPFRLVTLAPLVSLLLLLLLLLGLLPALAAPGSGEHSILVMMLFSVYSLVGRQAGFLALGQVGLVSGVANTRPPNYFKRRKCATSFEKTC